MGKTKIYPTPKIRRLRHQVGAKYGADLLNILAFWGGGALVSNLSLRAPHACGLRAHETGYVVQDAAQCWLGASVAKTHHFGAIGVNFGALH